MRPWKRCPPHDWFPGLPAREFIPVVNVCLRCRAEQVHLPWGQCLTAHPIAEHYAANGVLLPHPITGDCDGPY